MNSNAHTNMHTREEIEPEVLRAVRENGEGTFVSDDGNQSLTIHKHRYAASGIEYYAVRFDYSYLSFTYKFTAEQVEGITA